MQSAVVFGDDGGHLVLNRAQLGGLDCWVSPAFWRTAVFGILLVSVAWGAAPGKRESAAREQTLATSVLRGQCFVVSVAPDPTDPGVEGLKVLWGHGDGPADRVLFQGKTLQPVANIKTLVGGEVLLQTPDRGRVLIAERSSVRIDRVTDREGFWLYLKVGAIRLIGGGANVQSAAAMAARSGTDFEMRVGLDGLTEVAVFEGQVLLTNSHGWLSLDAASTNRAEVRPGSAPTPVLLATNVVQWWLRYPVVIDPGELDLPRPIRKEVERSFGLYSAGRYAQAVAHYPDPAQPESDAERVYAAALRLLAGDPPGAESFLRQIAVTSEPVRALLELIRTIQGQPSETSLRPSTASGWLAESYRCQARHDLPGARVAAYAATAASGSFLAAWARVAELELGREDIPSARKALERLQQIAPDHETTLAIEGFILLSSNHTAAAAEKFGAALERNPGRADAWFGLGLARLRQGRRAEGLDALGNAVALEPEHSLLRSYLSKALHDQFDMAEAAVQIRMAKELDPRDPTPWLYDAWFHQAQNRVNPAITNLEHSVELNDNLRLFRSRSQLDRDLALRGSSLARLYERAGMPEVALGEAVRAVSANYLDASAHLFLADSYNLLRDQTRFDLRYETAWFSEVLLANLLAPIGGGIVSPTLVGQEYARFYVRGGLSLSSFGEARSDGEFRQLATQAGTFGGTAYTLDLDWAKKQGTRPNHDLDRTELYAQVRQRFGQRDTGLLLVKFQDYSAGDNFQYLDPAKARRYYRFDEVQQPIAVGLWRHQWTPGVETLALSGWLQNKQSFTDREAALWIASRHPENMAAANQPIALDVKYTSRFGAWVGELSQIAQLGDHSLLVGVRGLAGSLSSSDLLTGDTNLSGLFGDSNRTGIFHQGQLDLPASRFSIYGYDTWQVRQALWLTAGVAWEVQERPSNFRHPPLENGLQRQSGVLPKAAVVWELSGGIAVRGMYAQSLGGIMLDESYRLEPVQLAGFSQAARTVIPESTGVGSVSGHELDLGGLAVDLRMPSQTYVTIEGTVTHSEVNRDIGLFAFDISQARDPPGFATHTSERIDFSETRLRASAHQLLGPYATLGIAGTVKRSELDRSIPFVSHQSAESAMLHVLQARGRVNSPSGVFGEVVANWYWQRYDSTIIGENQVSRMYKDNHVSIDLELGWHFPRRKGAVSVGIMNLLDEDYRLAPISGLGELPRERVFFARLWLNL